jgi:hypothetical protein
MPIARSLGDIAAIRMASILDVDNLIPRSLLMGLMHLKLSFEGGNVICFYFEPRSGARKEGPRKTITDRLTRAIPCQRTGNVRRKKDIRQCCLSETDLIILDECVVMVAQPLFPQCSQENSVSTFEYPVNKIETGLQQ